MTRALALLLLLACGDAGKPVTDGSPDAGYTTRVSITHCMPDETRCRAELLELCVPLESGASWVVLQDCLTAEHCISTEVGAHCSPL